MKNFYKSTIDTRTTTPFTSSEEAWFWYCLCEKLGFQRARSGDSRVARPCESSDIALSVKKLFRQGLLKPEHIKVLSKYGFEQVPPPPFRRHPTHLSNLERSLAIFRISFAPKRNRL